MISKVLSSFLKGVDTGLKDKVLKEAKKVADAFANNPTTLLLRPAAPGQRTANRAKGFGSAAGYVASSTFNDVVKLAGIIENVSPITGGFLLAQVVKKVFGNEGGKNE